MHDEITEVARHRQVRGGSRLAGVASDLARPVDVVGSTMPVGQLEVMFRNPDVSCVVVSDDESGRAGIVMRSGLTAALTGRLGYGRAVLERKPTSAVTDWSPMVVHPQDPVSSVATRAMERTDAHRYDDVLVAADRWLSAGTADLMRALVAALAERSTHDPQTRLPTRAATWHSLARRCELVQGSRTRVVLVLLDVHGMSTLNARHGYTTGDTVLVELASRLVGGLPRGCEAGRVDGDRFAVLATLPPMDDIQAAASADHLRRHVLANLAEPTGAVDVLVWPELRSSVVWSVTGAAVAEELVREAESRLARSPGAAPVPEPSRRPVPDEQPPGPAPVGDAVLPLRRVG
ncbi:diguanylate cyclase (GGDEF)-like protein [Isoptericola sp. CG 20/1183]|uniref:Diguanylate cyclase (GGDEF)-like protein n=1 Tax=Isoptericola halotolerans TaxID=300560 RepID=A0ABX5ED95_9MICO|nr:MULTISPECIES: diguanylate cyclase [Isoptericola]PRZ06375.1 diguanylate cyclase (GGDEF)-like protein [Isoptericola halotolerans]PRZ06819.1 diguanylate cyclase (GGDEF)-like protein [Isoptericola sp. CG 20/1183]